MTILIFWTKFAQEGYFQSKTKKSALVRSSMVVTYYIEFFRTRADRHNGILSSAVLQVAETINYNAPYWSFIY